ncbi:MAG: Re/Si-specific NAD(P)(+) transhydrogenase subunit alpha [Bacteroidetes bacterium]|nr:Re/Si-specific NAD(P)(+) transhydrogenase subunit alpha [Bacteroidota bacterium]
MIIGVLKEASPETRVSLTPEVTQALVKMGVQVWIAQGAGDSAFYPDAQYEAVGGKLVAPSALSEADILLTIHPENIPTTIKSNTILMGVFQPLFKAPLMKEWAGKGYTVFSLDTIPRSTRAQSMDVLSSQANIAGYKAVLLAASQYCRYFPMFMTAAGSIPPAKVVILGAGVAGLQAIATAKRLGAVIEVSDTRPAVKEEVMSLGAKFIEVEGAADASKAGGYAVEQTEEFQARQKARLAESVKKSDIIITTAQIPGRKAPVIITEEMVASMRPGSVIVDIAASTGGNVAGTKNNETVVVNGVTIIGNSNLAATAPADASKVYAKNVLNFLKLILDKDGNIALNFEDDIVKGTAIAHAGQIVNDRVATLLN